MQPAIRDADTRHTNTATPNGGTHASHTRPHLILRSGMRGKPIECRARLSVFFSSMAMVIGPTPPGTGVMAPATLTASAKSTSPQSL